jgi:hypothetical protein
MHRAIGVFCPTCFAIPGELCRTKYVVHGNDEVTPVICLTHMSRLVSEEEIAPALRLGVSPQITQSNKLKLSSHGWTDGY